MLYDLAEVDAGILPNFLQMYNLYEVILDPRKKFGMTHANQELNRPVGTGYG